MAVVRFDAYKTVAFGSITNSYTAIGSALTHAWRAFRISNNTDGDMNFSLDGTTNNLFVPAGSFVLYDICTNSPPLTVNDNLVFGLGTQFYIKYSTAPTTGAVYIEGLYARGE